MKTYTEYITNAKESEVEFQIMNDSEQLRTREFASKAAYLLVNLCHARENISRECRFKENEMRKVTKVSEKMKNELAFIAAACEELLKED